MRQNWLESVEELVYSQLKGVGSKNRQSMSLKLHRSKSIYLSFTKAKFMVTMSGLLYNVPFLTFQVGWALRSQQVQELLQAVLDRPRLPQDQVWQPRLLSPHRQHRQHLNHRVARLARAIQPRPTAPRKTQMPVTHWRRASVIFRASRRQRRGCARETGSWSGWSSPSGSRSPSSHRWLRGRMAFR